MTPGEKWLIDRLAEVVSGTTDGSARALQEDEQGHVMGFGLRNRILPVLFGRGRRELFPPSMLAVMRAAYHDQAVRNLRGFALLGGVLRSLSDREIPVIVLKGGFLAENVYRNIACRPMYDFDLLVRQANREEVDRILSAQGFSLTVPDKPLPESIYQHSATSMRLEIHWHISADQRSSFEVEDLWAGTMPTTVGGAHALALRPEVLLAHLCEHFTHHAFVLPALHLFDIAMVVRHYGAELDWPQFVVLARRWNMRRATFLLLRQVERLLGVRVPDSVLPALHDDQPDEETEDGFVERLLSWDLPGDLWLSSPAVIAAQQEGWRGLRGLLSKRGVLWKRLFPPASEMAERYSVPTATSRLWLYYPYRIAELALHCTRSWCRPRPVDAALHRSVKVRRWLADERCGWDRMYG